MKTIYSWKFTEIEDKTVVVLGKPGMGKQQC